VGDRHTRPTEGQLLSFDNQEVIAATMLNVTTFLKEISPALKRWTKILYMISGLLPVGRPRTKGLSGVGAKSLMRPTAKVKTGHRI
jgi:hypothetical protein